MERGKGICAVTSFVAASVAIFGAGGAAGDAAPVRPAMPAGAPAFAHATERAWPAPAHVSAPPFAHAAGHVSAPGPPAGRSAGSPQGAGHRAGLSAGTLIVSAGDGH